MNYNTKYVILVIILVSSLSSMILNGLVTIIILLGVGFVFWLLLATRKYQSINVNKPSVKSQK